MYGLLNTQAHGSAEPNFEQHGPVLVLTHNDHQRDGGSWVLRKSPARGDLGSAAQH